MLAAFDETSMGTITQAIDINTSNFINIIL